LEGNILPFWKKYAADPAGGFYGELAYDGSPVAGADKGCVLNARILWTFSAAARLLGDDESLQLANRAQRYFIDHFIDKEQGGAYWSLLAMVRLRIRINKLTGLPLPFTGCQNISGPRRTGRAWTRP